MALDSAITFITERISMQQDKEDTFSTTTQQYLLRIYGESVVDRKRELRYLLELQHFKVGPTVYGVFGNGRIEEFYHDAIVVDPLKGYSKSRDIASALVEFHSVIPRRPPPGGITSEGIWPILRDWYETAKDFEKKDFNNSIRYRKYVDLDWKQIQKEIDWMKQLLPSREILNGTDNALNVMAHHYGEDIKDRIKIGDDNDVMLRLEMRAREFMYDRVLCHNDVYVGNVLERKEKGTVVLIDFEYTSYNHRGYDFSTLFGRCERKEFRESDIPDAVERKQFIADYLSLCPQFERGDLSESEWECFLHYCDCVVLEFCMINAYIWGIWAVNQAVFAKIESVEYIDYARLRMHSQYSFFKTLWYEQYKRSPVKRCLPCQLKAKM